MHSSVADLPRLSVKMLLTTMTPASRYRHVSQVSPFFACIRLLCTLPAKWQHQSVEENVLCTCAMLMRMYKQHCKAGGLVQSLQH